MSRWLRILALVVVVQLLLVAVYMLVERGREAEPVEADRLSRPAPDLLLRSTDGETSRVSDRRGTTVVLHFWATWCPPCLEELPSLLDYAESGPVEVLAVSVDPDWPAVRSFVGGPLDHVYLADAEEVVDAYGVAELPQTFVIDPQGVLRLHFRGPQDWKKGSSLVMGH